MRSALLCVFFALIIERGSRASDDDFRPIPIPLDEWNYEKRDARVGTLHEAIRTEQPAVAVPAHYWEDALRHSVYLTLVRDKIDQLIARGAVVAPDSKPDHASKEVDDHDLWEKIKRAPFDRIQDEDHSLFGDVTIMAKGRLIEENGGFRFAEDERSKEECSDDKCLEGVKAIWSVKRVRQRDAETSPGRYHYELTFSVNSQLPKRQKRPYENPVRTFTVRENTPDTLLGTPQERSQERPVYQPAARPQTPRPQRAVWFHKNIAPKHYNNQGRFYSHGLDRIFSSFFSDDDSYPEPPSPRYKPNPYAPPIHHQYSKVGYVGMPSDQHQQKRLMPFAYKPNVYKYRPPLSAPPVGHMQHHYLDVDGINHQFPMQPPDHRYISPSNIVKTTRPAVMPTPPMSHPSTTPKNETLDSTNATTVVEETTKIPEMPPVYKPYTKPRPVKVSYFSEHVRPPIYNAPPGVFVTMEGKKPFKPMPPLKFSHAPKPPKRPIDFRPSPQLIDGQLFSNPETSHESAFRPILPSNNTESDFEDIEVYHSDRHGDKNTRKQTSKKPPKKHENIKSQRVTTTAPDIITVNNDSQEDDMQWADLLSAFTKTTPMDYHKPKRPMTEDSQVDSIEESTPPMESSNKKATTSTEAYEEKTSTTTTTTTTTTTPGPKKRTRPPHKFVKPDKVKKHKRVTTTTKAPEKSTIKKPSDLTPQASSAATGAPKTWKPKEKTSTTTTEQPPTITSTTSTTTTSTTTPAPTTRSSYEETTAKTENTKPTQPKNKNRFRISTLMQKGTSVKHDRWSVNQNTNTTEKKVTPTGKYPPRRKGSNFQGYGMSTTSRYTTHGDEVQKDSYSSRFETSTTTLASTAASTQAAPVTTQPTDDETNDYYHNPAAYTQHHDDREDDEDDSEEMEEAKINKNDDQQEAEDHSEFIFGVTSTTPSERTNEIEEDIIVTEQTVITTPHSVPKNKTKKCKKKKKNHHLVSTTTLFPEQEVLETTTPTPSSTKSSTGIDLLDEILDKLNYDDTTDNMKDTKPKQELDEEESENHEKYLKIDEDFEEFLGSLDGNRKNRHPDEVDDVEYEDEHETLIDDDVSPFDNEDVNESSRDTNDKDYDDYRERSYSLLELMAME